MSSNIQTLEFPDGATYGDMEITSIEFDKTTGYLCVAYKGSELYNGWDQLIFTGCEQVDDEIQLDPSGIPVGLISPQQSTQFDTPGANEAEKLYSILTDSGVIIREFNK